MVMGAVSVRSGMAASEQDRRLAAVLGEMYPTLVRALSAYVSPAEVAEDIAGDAMLRAWERRDQLAGVEDPVPWVYRVAINHSRSLRRRAGVELRHLPSLLRLRGERDNSDASDAVAVRAALRSLPARQREALVLRYYADLSVEQASGVMRCAPGTVKALTHQGLAGLRGRLQEESDEH